MKTDYIVLRKNSKEIIKKIEDAGISVCICATFEGSAWLDVTRSVLESILRGKLNGFYVHGNGYWDDDLDIPEMRNTEAQLKRFVDDITEGKRNVIWCDDIDTFIAEIKKLEAEIKEELIKENNSHQPTRLKTSRLGSTAESDFV